MKKRNSVWQPIWWDQMRKHAYFLLILPITSPPIITPKYFPKLLSVSTTTNQFKLPSVLGWTTAGTSQLPPTFPLTSLIHSPFLPKRTSKDNPNQDFSLTNTPLNSFPLALRKTAKCLYHDPYLFLWPCFPPNFLSLFQPHSHPAQDPTGWSICREWLSFPPPPYLINS